MRRVLGNVTGALAGVASLVLASCVLFGTPAASATGEPPTRSEYVDQLEAMCKPGAEATQRAMKGARQDVRKPKRVPIAAGKFDKSAKIFGGTVDRISTVPQPPGDEAKLAEWFQHLHRQRQYLEEVASQLHKGKTIKAQRLIARFIHNGNLSNNVVLPFGFDYCSFKFSRYG